MELLQELASFNPPSLQQATEYAKEIEFPLNKVFEFMSFYESKDWKVGKTKMKSWKLAMQTWMRRMGIKPLRISKSDVDKIRSAYARPHLDCVGTDSCKTSREQNS